VVESMMAAPASCHVTIAISGSDATFTPPRPALPPVSAPPRTRDRPEHICKKAHLGWDIPPGDDAKIGRHECKEVGRRHNKLFDGKGSDMGFKKVIELRPELVVAS
jgi:hypothetical protein